MENALHICICLHGRMKRYPYMLLCVCVEVGDCQSLSLSFCLAAALKFHYVVAPGSENVGFNWTLFRPFGVWLVESDPSASCSLSIQWLKNMMRRVACFWMDMSAAAWHILMTSLLKQLFNDGRAAFIRLKPWRLALGPAEQRDRLHLLYLVHCHSSSSSPSLFESAASKRNKFQRW